jgi:hypothetical protein
VIHTEFAIKDIADLWVILFPNKLLDRTISYLILYSRACGSYHDFPGRELLLTRKLLNQGFLVFKMTSTLRKFYARQHNFGIRYGVSVSQMTTVCRNNNPVLSPFMIYQRFCNRVTRGVQRVESITVTSEAHEYIPRFSWIRVA